jgi:hypothetical protein
METTNCSFSEIIMKPPKWDFLIVKRKACRKRRAICRTDVPSSPFLPHFINPPPLDMTETKHVLASSQMRCKHGSFMICMAKLHQDKLSNLTLSFDET